ncbi:TPA: conjugal transfer protein [Streptococcus pneumoniae]
MDKRKTIFTAVIIGAGIMAIIDRIKLNNKVEELKEKADDIGRCHNDFYLMQQRYNKNIDEQLATIQEEIGSVYEHFEELSKGKEDGR